MLLLVRGFVGETPLIDKNNLVMWSFIQFEPVLQDTTQRQVGNFQPDFLAELTNDGVAAVLTGMDLAPERPIEGLLCGSVAAIEHEPALPLPDDANGDDTDSLG
jgi:hypothetical protein